jgi:hypothetical protein
MRHLSSIVLAGAVVAAGAVACFSDPTSSLRNGASRIVLTRSSVFLPVGDSQSVQAELKDDQGNTYDVPDATWTTSNPAVAVVNVDASRPIPLDAFSRAFIRTVGAGAAWVYFESHGLKDSVQVYGLPLVFDGTVAHVANLTPRDTVTVSGTSALSFVASGANQSVVTVGGEPVFMISQTASQLQFLVPPVADGALNITNVMLNGVVRIGSLDAPDSLTVTNPPQSLTLYQDFYGTLTATDNDQYNQFTSTTADSIRIEISWDTDADIDGYFLDATAANYGDDGYAMATSANPETYETRLAAATVYYIEAYLYDGGTLGWTNYRIRTIKIQ